MDLLQTLLVRRQDGVGPAYTSANSERFALSSSQTSMSAPSSPQFISSQGFSLSQDISARMLSPASTGRPPSCGQSSQDGNADPFRTLPFELNGSTYQDNHESVENSLDDLPDTDKPQLVPIADWEEANPYMPKQKLVSATVPKSTGEYATKFQHQCDHHRVRPIFGYEEVSAGQFTATVTIGDETIAMQTPQPTKKIAKEEVCKMALEQMPIVEKMAGLENAGVRGEKRKSGDSVEEKIPERDASEDWISILNTYCQRNHLAVPAYEDGRTTTEPARFSAGVTIDDGLSEPFLSGSTTFANKRDSRATAAKNAVMRLRSQGKLEEAPPKRQRTSSGSGQASDDVAMATDSAKPITQEVHELIATLGFRQPRWVETPSTGSAGQVIESNFLDMAAHFDDRDSELEPRIKGPIGHVMHCLGRKKAREACCERVMSVLQDIKRSRLERS